MNIKLELLKNYISDLINYQLKYLDINADEIADTTAINALSEIQNIITNDDYSDFDIIEKITSVFEKYHLDFGNRHDF